jgi:hypothetical protein
MYQYADQSLNANQADRARVFLHVLMTCDPDARTHFPGIDEMLRKAGM